MPVACERRLAFGRQHGNLVANLQIVAIGHRHFDDRHPVALLKILSDIKILHITIYGQLVVLCATDTEAQRRRRTDNEVSRLVRCIVLQRQQACLVGTRLDGTVIVHRAADTARTAKDAFLKDMDNSIIGTGHGTDGTRQFPGLCLGTVVHHQYRTVEDAKSAAQVVLVTRNGIGSRAFLEDAEQRILVIA